MQHGTMEIMAEGAIHRAPIQSVELVDGQLRIIASFTGPREAFVGVPLIYGRDNKLVMRGKSLVSVPRLVEHIDAEIRYDLAVTVDAILDT